MAWEAETDEARTVVVTGASGGLGREIAVALGRLGWRVGVGARRREELEKTAKQVNEAGGSSLAQVMDVTDAGSVETFFDVVEAAFGPVDAVVCNAGIAAPGPIHDVDPVDIARVFEVNTIGAMYCARHGARSLLAREAQGDLVFITSDSAEEHYPHVLTYGASKLALEYLAGGMRKELTGTGVRVSCVQLGPTLSEFGFDWPVERLGPFVEAWQRFGVPITPPEHKMEAILAADAVVLAVTAPRGMQVRTLSVGPEDPYGAPTT